VWQKCNMQLNTTLKHFEEFLCWQDDCRRNWFDSALVTSIEIADEIDIPREFKQIGLRKKKDILITSVQTKLVLTLQTFSELNILMPSSTWFVQVLEGLKPTRPISVFCSIFHLFRTSPMKTFLQCCKELQVLLTLSETSDSDINGQELS
jgi:hypothetical protein